jgi:hypothetical protein
MVIIMMNEEVCELLQILVGQIAKIRLITTKQVCI